MGAGAAGITLAREFVGTSVTVCLLESGGFEADEETQALYHGTTIGMPYALSGTRLRYFGGSTNHWSGLCRPLDPIDFETRPWVPYSGWPFAFDDLKVYYERAQGACRLGPFDYDLDSWVSAVPLRRAIVSRDIETVMWQHNEPTQFGKAYRRELEQAKNVNVLLHANLTELLTDESLRRIEDIAVVCLQGPRFTVRAKLFVLACGGIENARLLLNSDKQVPGGLGNQHDLVGRFFSEHPHSLVNEAVFSKPDLNLAYYDWWVRPRPNAAVRAWRRLRQELGFPVSRQPEVRAGFAVSEEAQRRHGLLNWSVMLEPESYRPTSHLANEIGITTRAVETGSIGRDRPVSWARLFLRTEQAPNRDSRIMLDERRDALGLRRVILAWRLSELDRYSIREGTRLFGRALGSAGLGRVRLDPALSEDDAASWSRVIEGGAHHMGTTRASDDPHEGVVDGNGRVHGLHNLYVAGSSVFPTVGHANPTLTIVALAYRLADHLKLILQTA